MRLALTVVFVLLVAGAGYLFVPRTASLSAFDATAMAEAQTRMKQHEAAGENAAALLDHYSILNGQYGIAPIPAASASVAFLQAGRAFKEAADQADEEAALPFLEHAFSIIGTETGSKTDPAIIARLELVTWSLARDRSKERQLADAISEKLALLHGGTAREFQSTATDFARAARFTSAKNWHAAREAESAAWKKLRRLLDARSLNAQKNQLW
ncbi:MAG: hypothetical protein ACKOEZ_01620 [Spartobacteria bacterium]